MNFSLNALEVKEKKNILFSGKSNQTKKLIELILKKEENRKNILVLFDSSNYFSLMDNFTIISKKDLDSFSLPVISSKIHETQRNPKHTGILLFDSVTSMLSFNPPNAVYSFLFFESRKAKEMNYSLVCFIEEKFHQEEVLENIKGMMDYNFFFEFKGKKLFIELTAFPFNSIRKNYSFDL